MERDRIRAAGVDVLGIAQFNTDEKMVREFIAKHGIGYANVYDPDGQVASAYGIEGVPSYVMVDRDGLVAGGYSGARGVDSVLDLVERVQ